MEYVRKQIEGFEIFDITGNFVTGKKGNLSKEYSALIDEGKYKFIFDLSKVTFLDSSGLGTIIMGVSNVTKNNEKLRVVISKSNETLRTVFEYIKLGQVIDFYNNLDDAIKGVNKLP